MTTAAKHVFPEFKLDEKFESCTLHRYTSIFTGDYEHLKGFHLSIKVTNVIQKSCQELALLQRARGVEIKQPYFGYATYDPETGNRDDFGVVFYVDKPVTSEDEQNIKEFLNIAAEHIYYGFQKSHSLED